MSCTELAKLNVFILVYMTNTDKELISKIDIELIQLNNKATTT